VKTFDEKVDDAVHAAMGALGLSVATNLDTAELLNDRIAELARDLVSDDHEVDTDTDADDVSAGPRPAGF